MSSVDRTENRPNCDHCRKQLDHLDQRQNDQLTGTSNISILSTYTTQNSYSFVLNYLDADSNSVEL